MKYIPVKAGYLFLILIGVSVHSAWSMEEIEPEEEVIEQVEPIIPSKVLPLTELAIQPAVDKILEAPRTAQGVYAIVRVFPVDSRIPLALALIKDTRYPGTALDKLHLAYAVSIDAGNQQIPQLDALYDEVIKNIDPCDFVHKPLALLLPGYKENKFTLRDNRLIKSILRKPGLRLASQYLKQPILTIKAIENQKNEAMSPDGSMLAWGMDDNTLVIWHIQENRPVAVFKLPNTFADDPPIAWSPDSQIVAAADSQGTVYMWHVSTLAQPVVRLQVQGMHPAYYTEFDERGFADAHPFVKQYENNVEKLSEANKEFIANLDITNWVDEQQNIVLIYTNKSDAKRAITWYINRNTAVPTRIHFRADEHPIYSMSFSPDGRFLTTLSNEDHRVRIWDVRHIERRNEEALAAMIPEFEFINEDAANAVAAVLSSKATRVAVAPVQNNIVILDIENGRQMQVPTDSWEVGYIGLGANAIALSADGKYLAYTHAGKYYLYDIDNKKQIIEFERGHATPAQVFSPGQSFEHDGGFVSCAVHHPLVVYGMRSRGNLNVKFPFKQEFDTPSYFSGDGSYFVSRGIEKFNIWRLPTDYLKGNLTWQQLRDVLARMCLQIMPVQLHAH